MKACSLPDSLLPGCPRWWCSRSCSGTLSRVLKRRWVRCATDHGQPAARDQDLPPQGAPRPGPTSATGRAPEPRSGVEVDARLRTSRLRENDAPGGVARFLILKTLGGVGVA